MLMVSVKLHRINLWHSVLNWIFQILVYLIYDIIIILNYRISEPTLFEWVIPSYILRAIDVTFDTEWKISYLFPDSFMLFSKCQRLFPTPLRFGNITFYLSSYSPRYQNLFPLYRKNLKLFSYSLTQIPFSFLIIIVCVCVSQSLSKWHFPVLIINSFNYFLLLTFSTFNLLFWFCEISINTPFFYREMKYCGPYS